MLRKIKLNNIFLQNKIFNYEFNAIICNLSFGLPKMSVKTF
ncbi:hypothetical protein PHEL49_1872 [Polaribacter sp. Hel1_33_49]|jgi:hypothetical protein|nr:hypothetical protein PHEL49_1872 [Polaribacter sp. Hel1_33_49]